MPRYKDGTIRDGDRTATRTTGKLTDIYASNTILSQQFNRRQISSISAVPATPHHRDVLARSRPSAWYSGGFDLALLATTGSLTPSRKGVRRSTSSGPPAVHVFRHFDPKSPGRKEHLRDAKHLPDDIRSGQLRGRLLQPSGFQNQHPDYSNSHRRPGGAARRRADEESTDAELLRDSSSLRRVRRPRSITAKPPIGAAAGRERRRIWSRPAAFPPSWSRRC